MRSVARWVVVMQFGYGNQYRVEEVTRFESTPEQARATLYEIACTHRPRPSLRQQHREVFRVGDGDAYYVHIAGMMSTYRVLYRLAELAWSTGAAPAYPQ
ncbi:hypothetical protein [Streptomyces sp. GbtcB6]|uniref:hypothetical protein n=1 Tax=Streptomyces sp. GbtcB6 TaxID=2824751 RepID=UPI0027E4DD2A|nr:hypothetical protein [Streptomyces sp. GbtcB6]